MDSVRPRHARAAGPDLGRTVIIQDHPVSDQGHPKARKLRRKTAFTPRSGQNRATLASGESMDPLQDPVVRNQSPMVDHLPRISAMASIQAIEQSPPSRSNGTPQSPVRSPRLDRSQMWTPVSLATTATPPTRYSLSPTLSHGSNCTSISSASLSRPVCPSKRGDRLARVVDSAQPCCQPIDSDSTPAPTWAPIVPTELAHLRRSAEALEYKQTHSFSPSKPLSPDCRQDESRPLDAAAPEGPRLTRTSSATSLISNILHFRSRSRSQSRPRASPYDDDLDLRKADCDSGEAGQIREPLAEPRQGKEGIKSRTPRRGPAAGIGHERYGRFGATGKSFNLTKLRSRSLSGSRSRAQCEETDTPASHFISSSEGVSLSSNRPLCHRLQNLPIESDLDQAIRDSATRRGKKSDPPRWNFFHRALAKQTSRGVLEIQQRDRNTQQPFFASEPQPTVDLRDVTSFIFDRSIDTSAKDAALITSGAQMRPDVNNAQNSFDGDPVVMTETEDARIHACSEIRDNIILPPPPLGDANTLRNGSGISTHRGEIHGLNKRTEMPDIGVRATDVSFFGFPQRKKSWLEYDFPLQRSDSLLQLKDSHTSRCDNFKPDAMPISVSQPRHVCPGKSARQQKASAKSLRERWREQEEMSSRMESYQSSVDARSDARTGTDNRHFTTLRRATPNNSSADMTSDKRSAKQSADAELMLNSILVGKWLSFGKTFISPLLEEVMSSSNKSVKVLVIDGLGKNWSHYCATTHPSVSFYHLDVITPDNGFLPRPTAPSSPNHTNIAHHSLSSPLPFPADFFSGVVIRFPNAAPDSTHGFVLAEARRVLRPGGHLEVCAIDIDMINMGNCTRRALRTLKETIHSTSQDTSLRNVSDTFLTLMGKERFDRIHRCHVGVPVAGRISTSPSASTWNSARGSQEMKVPALAATANGSVGANQFLPELSDMLSGAHAKTPIEARCEAQMVVGRVAEVGRWWHEKCYIDAIADKTGRRGSGTDGKDGFWSPDMLKECEWWGTSFKLLLCYARKPEYVPRRTISL